MIFKRIIRALVRRGRDGAKLLMFWKPDFVWLYRNRHLRMDANMDIIDKRRRDFHIDRYEFAARYLRDMKNSGLYLLDAACGTGYGSNILKKAHPEQIVGVDISPRTVAYATKNYGDESCMFRVSDVTQMDGFDEASFDAVVSFETIEHFEQPFLFLEHIHRLLKKDGKLILSTPNKWGPTKDHKFDYNYDTLQKHVKTFFSIEDLYVQNSGCMDLWINRGAPRRLVKATPDTIEQAECFIVVCRKG